MLTLGEAAARLLAKMAKRSGQSGLRLVAANDDTGSGARGSDALHAAGATAVQAARETYADSNANEIEDCLGDDEAEW